MQICSTPFGSSQASLESGGYQRRHRHHKPTTLVAVARAAWCPRIPCIPLPECEIEVFGKQIGYVFRFQKIRASRRPRHSGVEGKHGINRNSVKDGVPPPPVAGHRESPGPYSLDGSPRGFSGVCGLASRKVVNASAA